MAIDYPRFYRLLTRVVELAARGDVDPSVKRIYEDKVAGVAATFMGSHKGLLNAEVAARKERREGLQALETVDQPFRVARVVAQKYVVDLAIPKTLKSLSTETDKRNAIRELLELLDAHDDEPGWAKDLTDGEFGRLAPQAIRELSEWIDASANVEKAVRERIKAYAAAYGPFLDFRDVVREVYSSKSTHYRRLMIRPNGKLVVDDPVDGPSDDDPIDPIES